MQLNKASRKKAKIKMCLQGPSGSGKTYSSLLLAYGLCNDWTKIAIIDTENHSADLYSHLGPYNVLQLSGQFTPERYIEAINYCESKDMEVIIIDSISNEWQYILEAHALLKGNSFTNWQLFSARHNQFVKAMLESKAHIIATTRTKQEYVLNERNGRVTPEKVGLRAIQRNGLEYDFTLVFDLNMKNLATASKDRTGLFSQAAEINISVDTGRTIFNWCNSGANINADDVTSRINTCKSVGELLDVYKQYPEYKEVLKKEYEERKRTILIQQSGVEV